jgi:2'-5' RNA ligase
LIRAFFAIDLDESSRDAVCAVLAALQVSPGGEGVRWVRREALHVTLCFLGNIEPAQVAPLAQAVGSELAGQTPFALTLGEARLFPSPRKPRVVALEVGPEVELSGLAQAVVRGMETCGFEPEDRRFRAHLTLGRIKQGRGPATAGLRVPEGNTTPVRDVVLFRSELERSGAKYTPLERMELGGSVHP